MVSKTTTTITIKITKVREGGEVRGPLRPLFGPPFPRTALPLDRPPTRLRGLRGFTQQPENSKREHFRALALQTPPKFHETPKRGKNERKQWWEEKREILGLPPLGAPPFGAPRVPPCRGPFFWVLGPTLRGPTLRGPRILTMIIFKIV